jgi:hypothetical protein
MPVPRGSLFGVPDENFPRGDPNKKHIKWDDENLRQNELTKTAKDIIDEPDTPWASPPPELFDSEEEIEEEEQNGRKISEEEIKQRLEGLEMEGGREEEEEEEERDGTTTTTTTTTKTNTRRSTGVQFVAASGGDCFSKEGEEEEEEENGNGKSKDALLFDDTVLKSRLFEAQRKSLQCTYDRKKGTTFNKTAHPFAHDDNRDKYNDEDEDDKDEEEIRRELEALLNMQQKAS